MAERRVLRLPFGGGLDRSTGALVVRPATFEDLRDVYLSEGRAEVRRGMLATVTSPDDDAVVCIAAIGSQGLMAVLTWRAADATVRLAVAAADGSGATDVGVVWTLAAGSSAPRVVAADSYRRLIIAHDEPNIDARQTTKVFDPFALTITSLQADLDGGGLADVKFRGVRRHLAYVVGWGFGTAADPDRPEVVRISIAGDPTTFKPEHYALAGQRGDPIVACTSIGTLAVRKESESYELVGANPATFGIVLRDGRFGAVGAALAVEVAGRDYFWSRHGPRVGVAGAASEDLGLALALDGIIPDPLADEADVRAGVAMYHPAREEVEFVFGRWGYALHLREMRRTGAPAWSYRVYGHAITAAAIIADTASAAVGPSVDAQFSAADGTAPGYSSGALDVTASYSGALVGGEKLEVWAFVGGAWTKETTIDAVAPTTTYRITGLALDTDVPVAFRLSRLGLYSEAFQSANPADWPASARGTGHTLGGQMEAPAALNANRTLDDVDLTWVAIADDNYQAVIEESPTGTNTWTEVGTLTIPPDADGFFSYTTTAGVKDYRVKYTKANWQDSPYSNIATA